MQKQRKIIADEGPREFLTLRLFYASGAPARVLLGSMTLRNDDVKMFDWPIPRGSMTSSQVRDLHAKIEYLVTEAVISFVGIQEVMEA